MLSQTARDRSVDVWNIIEHTFLSLHSCAMVVISPGRNRCGLFDYSLRLISILLTTRNLWSRSPPKHGETARVHAAWRSSGQDTTLRSFPLRCHTTVRGSRSAVCRDWETAGDFVVEDRWWMSSCVGAIQLVCAESVKNMTSRLVSLYLSL